MRKTVSAYDAWTCPTKLQKIFLKDYCTVLPYRTKVHDPLPLPTPPVGNKENPFADRLIDLS